MKGATLLEVQLKWAQKIISIEIPRLAEMFLDAEHSTLKCKLRANGLTFCKPLWPLFCRLTAAEAAIEGGDASVSDNIKIANDSTRKRLRAKSQTAVYNDASPPVGTTGGMDSPSTKCPKFIPKSAPPTLVPWDVACGNMRMSSASNATVAEAFGVGYVGNVGDEGVNIYGDNAPSVPERTPVVNYHPKIFRNIKMENKIDF
jgi:hypothetical protein